MAITPFNGWFTRGYTGHEHLYKQDLINMNGRMYDPIAGRMLSPDNYVQDPTSLHSFNRYSYVINNPLKYTDPSGQIIKNILFGPTACPVFDDDPKEKRDKETMVDKVIAPGGGGLASGYSYTNGVLFFQLGTQF